MEQDRTETTSSKWRQVSRPLPQGLSTLSSSGAEAGVGTGVGTSADEVGTSADEVVPTSAQTAAPTPPQFLPFNSFVTNVTRAQLTSDSRINSFGAFACFVALT